MAKRKKNDLFTVQFNLDKKHNFMSRSEAEHLIFVGNSQDSFSKTYDSIKFEDLQVVQILEIKNFYTDSKCKM